MQPIVRHYGCLSLVYLFPPSESTGACSLDNAHPGLRYAQLEVGLTVVYIVRWGSIRDKVDNPHKP